MPRTHGALNVEPSRFIVENQFAGLPMLLRIWNTAAVAMNLYQMKPDMAERYLECNLLANDIPIFEWCCKQHQKLRHPLFGFRGEDNVRNTYIGYLFNPKEYT